MDEDASPVQVLRLELKGILSGLDSEIKNSYPTPCLELSRRIEIAEISIVRDLTSFVREALLGEVLPHEPRCTNSGLALDLRDSLAVFARDIKLEREKKEEELASFQKRPWPADLRKGFQSLIDSEQRSCLDLDSVLSASREEAAALRILVSNITDACLGGLLEAEKVPSKLQSQIGEVANQKVEGAVTSWLSWKSKRRKSSELILSACPPIAFPKIIMEACSYDEAVSSFLACVRMSMKLRRQQMRILAAQHRITSILAACEVFSSLQRSIQLH